MLKTIKDQFRPHTDMRYLEIICDTDADFEDLPQAGAGSTALSVASGTTFMVNASGNWVPLGGGIIGGSLEGDGQEFHQFAPTTLAFRSTEPLEDFQEVQVNGETVDPENYDLEEGSTIVKFKPDFLKTLGNGKHKVAIVSKNNVVSGNFDVKVPDLNEHGFYYNQPYSAYSEMFGGNIGLIISRGIFAAYFQDGSLFAGTWGIDDGNIRVSTDDLTLNMVISADGLYCVEIDTMFRLDSELFVSDGDYVYIYSEEYNGYVVCASNWYQPIYKDIMTGIYDKPTVAIGYKAFRYTDGMVNCPRIPNDVTIIEAFAFDECNNLNSIVLPASITAIGENALCCKSLMNITFEGTVAQWNSITKGNGWNQLVPATHVQCADGTVAL